MNKKYYLPAMAIALAGVSATSMIAAGSAPETRADNTFAIEGLNPQAGSTVKQLNSVTILVNSNYGEFMVGPDFEKVSEITLTSETGTVVTATEFGEFGFDEATFNLMIPVNFPTVAEAGTYTLSIPEGSLVEADWNMTPVAGGKVSEAMTATFIIDPAMKGKLENYRFMPEAGSSVTTLAGVKLLFPELPVFGGFQMSEDDAGISISNGEKTYSGSATQDWSGEEPCKAMNFFFEDEDGEEPVFTSGKWTLTLSEGAFVYEGEKSPAMEAVYTVIAPSEDKLHTWDTFPYEDMEVKSLRSVRLMYMLTDPEISLNVNQSLIDEIRLLRDGKNTWAEFEFDEPSLVMNDMVMALPIVFDSQSMPGEYELVLPEGLLYQTRYNEATGVFDVFDGYQISASKTIVYEVSQDAKGLLEDVTMNPEAGTVQNLDELTLTFNSIPGYLQINQLGFDDITLVQGETEYVGVAVKRDYNSVSEYSIKFVDNTGEEAAVGPGSWKLTIPEGYFMFEGSQSPEMVATYDICPMVVTPAAGSTLTEITEFEVSFPGAKTAEFVGSTYMITLISSMFNGIPEFNVEKVEGTEIPTFRLTPPEGFPEPSLGYITFGIEEGAFMVDGKESPRIQASYYYNRPVSQEVLPEPNAEEVLCQSWGYTVGFVFDASTTPYVINFEDVEVKFDDTVLRIGSESQCYAGNADCAYSVMDNILSFFVVNSDFHKEGTITVTMKGDSYILSGTPGFDVSHTWRVVMPKEYGFTLTPSGGETESEPQKVESLDEMILVFEDAETADVFMQSGISLRKDDYSLFMSAEIEAAEDAETPTYKLKFTAPDGKEMTNGLYQLSIRFGTFTLDGVQSWPANYTDIDRFFDLDVNSGVEGVGTDSNVKMRVITLDGKVILNEATEENLKTLDNGVYIVNGKKMIIRK